MSNLCFTLATIGWRSWCFRVVLGTYKRSLPNFPKPLAKPPTCGASSEAALGGGANTMLAEGPTCFGKPTQGPSSLTNRGAAGSLRGFDRACQFKDV